MLDIAYFYMSIFWGACMCVCVCTVPRNVCFSTVPWFRAFHVCSSGILWTVLKWFCLPVSLLVTLLPLHLTYIYYYHYYYPCYHLYAGYLQLCTWNKPCLYGICSVAAVLYLQFVLHVMLFVRYIQCCSCSVFTVCATCNVICTVYAVLQLFCIYSLCYM